MKSIIYFIMIGIAAIQLISCDSDSKESEEKVFLKQLSQSWKVGSVEVDGDNVTGAFDDMQITFTENKTITVVNPVHPIWPATGSFELIKTGNSFSIDRNDGVIISVINLTESSLVMSFNYSAGSRLSSVSGDYTFEMNP